MGAIGPSKDYDNLYGKTQCKLCQYFRKSKKIQDKWRCIMPENVIEGHFGITYMKSPESRNHLGKCADFTRKEDDK